MKKIAMIIVLLGCALVYLQQQSLAEKLAQTAQAAPASAEPAAAPVSPEAAPAAPAPAEAPAPAPAPAKEAAAAPAEDGKQSHADFAKMAINDCNVCHQSQGIAPNHLADFFSSHRVPASKAGNNCQQCHKQSWCLDCHQGGGNGTDLSRSNSGRDYMPKSHRSDFIMIHPIKAVEDRESCFRCHDQKNFCNDCHSRFPKGNLRIKSHLMLGPNGQQYTAAFGEHSTEARRNLQSCQACHPEGDVCIQCHSTGKVRPHPRNWKAGNFKDRTNEKVCLKCHLPGTY